MAYQLTCADTGAKCPFTVTTEGREELMNKSMMYRLMCLAFVTGWFTGMSEEETLELIERAKRTKGDVSQAFLLRKQV